MFILSMSGEVLAQFNKWDLKSVTQAETWIAEHGMVIVKCGTIMGTFIVTVIRK